MSNKKVIILCLVAFAAGWFAKGYLSTATAAEVEDNSEQPKEETAED